MRHAPGLLAVGCCLAAASTVCVAADDQAAVAPHPAARALTADSLSVCVTAADDESSRYQMRVLAVDLRGATREWRFEGALGELEAQLTRIPAGFRAQVRQSLEHVAPAPPTQRTLRLVLQPQRDERRNYRLIVDRLDAEGRPHLLQFDFHLDAKQSANVDEVLRVDVVAEQLREISPEIRHKLAATLRQVRTPQSPAINESPR